jgi:ankyrin repeat protein
LQLEWVLDFGDPRERRRQFNTLPGTMEDTYEKMFTRIYAGHAKDERKALALRIFSWIYYAQRPMLLRELCEAISVVSTDDIQDLNAYHPEYVREFCRGMVVWEQNSDTVRFTHKTVRDFLKRKYRKQLFLTEIPRGCLKYLRLPLFNEGPCSNVNSLEERLKVRPFSRYASQFWAFHAHFELEDFEAVADGVVAVFREAKARNSILQIESYCNTTGANVWFTKGQTLLHVLADKGLEAICKFVLAERGESRYNHIRGTLVIENSRDYRPPPEELSGTDENKDTPLHYASRKGHPGVVQLLLKARLPLEARNNKGETALICAAAGGQTDVVDVLLNSRAKIDATNKSGESALMLAARYGHLEVFKKLLGVNADLRMQDGERKTVLHHATWNKGSGATEFFSLTANEDIEAQDSGGRTPLHWAARNENLEVVLCLMERNAKIGTKDDSGYTALHWAVWNEKADIVMALLDADADVTTQDNGGKTALHWAAKSGNSEIVKALLLRMPNSTLRDKEGMAAVHWAAFNSDAAVVNAFIDTERSNTLRDEQGRTTLHWAAFCENLGVVTALLERHVDVNEKDNNGYTALHWAMENRGTAVIRVLLEANADAMIRDVEGRTPLHWAAMNGKAETVKVILDCINDISAKDKDGKTAMDLAQQYRKAQVISLFQDKFKY